MNELGNYILILGAGILLGAFFFGGLMWTTKKGLFSKNPALIFVSSALLRISVVLLGFYYLAAHNWINMVVCLIGFILARSVITRFVSYAEIKKNK